MFKRQLMQRAYLPLVLILFLGLMVRLYIVDYPLQSEEANRDYLFARHISFFDERPIFGNRNGSLEIFPNSPTYNYITALPLLIHDSALSLSIANIVFQLAMVVAVYFITRKIFDEDIAILSAVILALGKIFLTQSLWMWQPHLAVPLFYIALALLFTRFNLVSPILLSISIATHLAVLIAVPVYVFMAIKHWKTNKKKLLIMFAIFIFSLLILFIPSTSYTLPKLEHTSNFRLNVLLPQHFYSLLPLLVVLVIASIKKLIKNRKLLYALVVLVIAIPNLFNPVQGSFQKDRSKEIGVITNALANKVRYIENSRNLDNLNFFTFDVHASAENNWFEDNLAIYDAIFWAPLEKKLNTQFVRLDDKRGQINFTRLNTDDFVFVSCPYFSSDQDEEENCLNKFQPASGRYILVEKIKPSENFSFYLMEKTIN